MLLCYNDCLANVYGELDLYLGIDPCGSAILCDIAELSGFAVILTLSAILIHHFGHLPRLMDCLRPSLLSV